MKTGIAVVLLIAVGAFGFTESKSPPGNLSSNVVPPQTLVTDVGRAATFGLGITTPLFGTTNNVYYDGRKFTKGLSGLNPMLGWTWRNYFGRGLPENGAAPYWEFFTMAIIVPFVGVGVDIRFGGVGVIGFGFPDIIHGSFVF